MNSSVTQQRPNYYYAILLPLAVLFMQYLSWYIVLAGAISFCLIFIFHRKNKLFLIISIMLFGHAIWLLWASFIGYLESQQIINSYMGTIANRLGLAGYLILFFVWNRINAPVNKINSTGNWKAIIRMPLIFSGHSDPAWRFLLIFSGAMMLPLVFFFFTRPITATVVLYGLIFSLVNSLLEELLWRKYFLERVAENNSGQILLVSSAIAFGFYHISLGFPLWVCLVFSIGGYYMSGAAICTKGITVSILMHIMVNLIFVFAGMIF